MKKRYIEPELELELYTLDASIASNCKWVVSNGPEMNGEPACKDFPETYSLYSRSGGPYNINFYEDGNCDCYTTGENAQYWTS